MSTPPAYIPVVVALPPQPTVYKNYIVATTAPASVLNFPVGAVAGSFRITPQFGCNSFTTGSLTYTITYTSEFAQPETTTIYTATTIGIVQGLSFTIRAQANTNVILATSGTFTATYNVGAVAEQILP